jgi:pimeloyl-ACP methyl ester carboxylesterase
MTTFALMHGGQHGGWCWELLTPELEAAGFGVVAPDMPIDDPAAGAAEWAGAVAAALDGVSDDVVAVAHSMGGLALPVLASLRPVRHMVFLGAMVPVPGQAFLEYLGTAGGPSPGTARGRTSTPTCPSRWPGGRGSGCAPTR